jgi:hypothetical protein
MYPKKGEGGVAAFSRPGGRHWDGDVPSRIMRRRWLILCKRRYPGNCSWVFQALAG